MRQRRDALKRAVDLVVGIPALIVSLPVQLVVGGLVWQRLGSPVLFRQVRPGKDGRPFEMLKFRTMLPPTPELQDDAARLTPFGRRLRATSLDELPALWNVVRGDMSLVGPRPLLMSYLDRYTPEQARRHEVRPGLTGLAQVNGRNAVSWDERLALDVEYVDTRCLAQDLRIIVGTIAALNPARGISAPGHATMPEFMGSASADRT